MKYSISCSIVTYKNDLDVLQKVIKSFLSSGSNLVLYIYDNSPSDQIRTVCEDNRIVYYHDPSNVGFSKGHNYCIKQIMGKSEYHLILNPDIYFEPNVLDALVDQLKTDSSIGLIAPKVFYPEGDLQYSCRLLPAPIDLLIRRIEIFSKIFKKRLDRNDLKFTSYNKVLDVPFILGCFMLVPVHVFEEIGFFDERFFMYMEDFDLTRRIKRKYKTIFYPDVHITHGYERASSKNVRLLFMHIKSAVQYFNKWGWFYDAERIKYNRDTIMKY